MKNVTYTVWGWNSADQDYNQDNGTYEDEADAIAHADIVDNLKGETIVEKVWEDGKEIQAIQIYNTGL